METAAEIFHIIKNAEICIDFNDCLICAFIPIKMEKKTHRNIETSFYSLKYKFKI